ncbi:aldehyde dehydrogenase (NADP(+)) [Frondihabitans cladoniiphilus]|uniref:Aldehyde dehydrogenase (NADP(+)) n=1 Tax=Frondihabitans cladoniiphilus TaxID=715785 RepID=A0ABP8W6H1_9MICO
MTSTLPETSASRLDALVSASVGAARPAADASDEDRARWLESVAARLDLHADELVPLADAETHLGTPRLTGELARTTAQLRLFAAVLREGSFLEATIDHANPDAIPAHGDLRRLLVPLGPVAVFAASNFPFAFSVAGGDTASAFAVGCPVVVKAHPGHPRLSQRVAALVTESLADAGAPEGLFGLIEGVDAGIALVEHPAIRAAGFTGSVAGGRALFDRAAGRPSPIPFYGELGSVNPVVVTAAAAEARGTELAQGLAASFTQGAGQFCTKPGVVFVPSGVGFEDAVVAAVPDLAATLLTPAIRAGFGRGLAALAAESGVTVLAGDAAQDTDVVEAGPVVLATDVAAAVAHPAALLEECFGPVTLLVRYDTPEELLRGVRAVPGSLTATLHAQPDEDLADLVAALRDRAGRLLFAGWPTGVAVTWSQHHGGPYPSTTSIHTSVGSTAARRFQRPVAYQDAPAALLPAALRDDNPLGIVRRVDGVLGLA